MKGHSKYHLDKGILFCLVCFMIISIITIYISETLLVDINYYYIKQLIWYFIGFIFIFFMLKFGNNFLYQHIYIYYIIGNILLLALLIFADPINEAKCWFVVKGVGTIQPSEFMKIILIILISKELYEYKIKYPIPSVKQEFLFLLKIIVILIPPSLLTFLEPDTGVVLIYFLITIVMLFLSGIRYRWFVLLFFIIFLFVGSILFIYFTQEEAFINIFGNSFFLRVNRLLDWSNKSGYQLENSLISIGSSGLFGHGFNLSLYFPEPQTDFIFAVFASSFGLVGSILLICLIAYFDLHLIKIAKKSKFKMDQYIINGILGMLIYQQFQNIGMTFGLMPITGITLPFISYGGSSLLSYLIMIGIIFNISNSNNKYTNS
jgi:rod shape determining protein RodA